MKKILLFISLIVTASIFFACNKQKTAQELLKEEKKAIERFISENGIIVTKDTTDMRGKNVFYKTKEGLYIHVIDPGNGNKAKYNQEILVRFKDMTYFKDDTTKYSNMLAGNNPDKFYYGNAYSYSGWACEGWAIGLSLVSDDAEVSLIIPSGLQPTSKQSSFLPVYYGFLKYRFK